MTPTTHSSRKLWLSAAVLLAVIAGAAGVWFAFDDADAASDARQRSASDDGFVPAEVDEVVPERKTVAEREDEEPKPDDEPTVTAEERERASLEAETVAEELTDRATRVVEQRSMRPGQSGNRQDSRMGEDFEPAVLRIVTNFTKADVTVNGMSYPEYVDEGDEDGMVLPAGGPYTVEVTYDGKTKTYTLSLRPHETRLLMVELSGFRGGNVKKATSSGPPRRRHQKEEDDDDEDIGRVTVYSKPKGSIEVDGNGTGEDTPGTVKVDPGKHDISVTFEDGSDSRPKTVRVRNGSRIKLFFRKRD